MRRPRKENERATDQAPVHVVMVRRRPSVRCGWIARDIAREHAQNDYVGTEAPPTWQTRWTAHSHVFWREEIAILVTALAAANGTLAGIGVR